MLSQKHLTSPSFGRLPDSTNEQLKECSRPHIESFNYTIKNGLTRAIEDIQPVEFSTENGTRIKIYFTDASINFPSVPRDSAHVATNRVYPSECRQRKTTYTGRMTVKLGWKKNNVPQPGFERNIGEVPIMLMSDRCNLNRLTPTEMVARGEDAQECGGYFVVNGVEKFLRLLIVPRRNYPIATIRAGWKTKGKFFSQFGITMRCVRDEHTANGMILHYLTNGTCKLMFSYRKESFFVPVVLLLKALCDEPDKYIYTEMIRGREDDSFFKGCIKTMLRDVQNEGLIGCRAVRRYIGERFRVKLFLPEWYTDEEVALFLFKRCICIHLNSNKSKFDLLIYMTRKLFALAKGQCAEESPDNIMNQEVLLGGNLYLLLLKEKLEDWQNLMKVLLLKKLKTLKKSSTIDQSDVVNAAGKAGGIDRPMAYLLATGNLISKTGLGLMETSGLSIVLDKINYLRLMSHFQSVHRGAFFTTMRTTVARKLRPEAWGFICPVHTPDGTPCGLLNHLSIFCKVVAVQCPKKHLVPLFIQYGLRESHDIPVDFKNSYSVFMDGEVLGWVVDGQAKHFCNNLRYLKAAGKEKVPKYLEIGFVEKSKVPRSPYPGIYLFTSPSRLMRQVKNLHTNDVELLGTFEQVFMNIAIEPEDAKPGYEELFAHQELGDTSMLSFLANTIPFLEHNPSPRNIYQCQMAKQSMGTPSHALRKKPDSKIYRLQTPQSPLVRTAMYDKFDLDDYSVGTNAVVAVMSYTGYDMEDAMVINKASLDRGFCHGSIYKSEFVDLQKLSNSKTIEFKFGVKKEDYSKIEKTVDVDGLPHVGCYMQQGDAFYSYINLTTGESKVQMYKSSEPAYVDTVRLLGNDTGTQMLQQINVTLRQNRNPIVGDKFANRHGQKGVCSMAYPLVDMPFAESGMVPDIIFNPHGFPSRMTIGMVIECMAGKSAVSHGLIHDATPFQFDEEHPAIEFFGEMLEKAGYNYYGNERFISGTTGEELEADIFCGVIYYQRLRHMVSDKFQVRSTGPIDQLTHQPIKGRKLGGGIRFGEMERDSLIAHGTAYLLKDRLLNCSDRSLEYVCAKCGSLVSPLVRVHGNYHLYKWEKPERICTTCDSSKDICTIAIPFVFKYFVYELALMNIRVVLDIDKN